jgi:MFS family permease
MPLAGRLADRYSPRILTSIGAILVGTSLVLFGFLDPLSGWGILVLPQFIRGAGLALLMAPVLAASLNAVKQHEIPMASGFLNVAQYVGGALGIALINNYVTGAIQRHAVQMGAGFPPQSAAFQRFARAAPELIVHHAPGILANAQFKTGFLANQTIALRASVLGYDNGFVFTGLILLAAMPLCLLLRPAAHQRAAAEKRREEIHALIAD